MHEENRRLPVFDPEDDDHLSAGEHMIAGATAGITEHAVMHPVDTIKTRMQVFRSGVPEGMFKEVKTIVRTEGPMRLWRGIGAVLVSAGPAHAVHFATFEALKQYLSSHMSHQPVATGIAGGLATVTSEGLMAPLDVVKQRMQLSSESRNRTILETVHHIYRRQGISAFFAGYKTTLVMSVPFTTVQYSIYEAMKRFLIHFQGLTEHSYTASSHCLAGAIAGASASAVTTPLDVVKTRLQTQGIKGSRQYKNMFDCFSTIWIEEGPRALLRGIQPRVLFYTPAAAICWTTYELCKHVLGLSNHAHPEEAVNPHSTTL